jgi:hypothetical protein
MTTRTTEETSFDTLFQTYTQLLNQYDITDDSIKIHPASAWWGTGALKKTTSSSYTFNQCIDDCTLNNQCTGVTYNKDDASCWLRSGVSSSSSKSTSKFNSAVKQNAWIRMQLLKLSDKLIQLAKQEQEHPHVDSSLNLMRYNQVLETRRLLEKTQIEHRTITQEYLNTLYSYTSILNYLQLFTFLCIVLVTYLSPFNSQTKQKITIACFTLYIISLLQFNSQWPLLLFTIVIAAAFRV